VHWLEFFGKFLKKNIVSSRKESWTNIHIRRRDILGSNNNNNNHMLQMANGAIVERGIMG